MQAFIRLSALRYYIAIGEGIKAVAADAGVEVFMLAPQSGADINGQMGMIQDVLTQDVDAIIFGTHDEFAAAPLIKKAVDKGMAVMMINSDIPNFPTPIHGVVGYSQRNVTHNIPSSAPAVARALSRLRPGPPARPWCGQQRVRPARARLG